MTALLLAAGKSGLAIADQHPREIVLHLRPRELQAIPVPLGPKQCAEVTLRLQGGIVGLREIGSDGSQRPLWLVDLGRGASLHYVLGCGKGGSYALQFTSSEKEKVAEVAVTIGSPFLSDDAAKDAKETEDLLANADLIRRHRPDAPASLDAMQLYDRAATLSRNRNDIPLERLILTQEARYLIFRKNQFTRAKTVLEQAVGLPDAGDPAYQALAWKSLSTADYDLGEYELAIQTGLHALELYRQTGDRYWQGIVLGNLSSVYAEIGQNANALSAAQQALEDAKTERDIAGVVYCSSLLAGLYQQQGDLESARRIYQQGLEWNSQIGYAPLVEAELQKDLGAFYTQIGEWSPARAALKRCLILERGQDDPVSLEARGLLAEAIRHEGRVRDAAAQDTLAIAIAHRLGLKQEETKLLLERAALHLELKEQGQAEDDIRLAGSLASELMSIPLQIALALESGDVFLEGNAEKAASSYGKGLRLAELAGEREQQSSALAGLAKAQQQAGRLEEAADSIESALRILEASRSRFSKRDLQVTYFSVHHRWYERAVDLCMQLAEAHPAGGYIARAFNYTERARAQALLDTLNSSGYSATTKIPAELGEAYARNQHARDDKESQLAHDLAIGKGDSAQGLQQLDQEKEDLNSRMEAVTEPASATSIRRIASVSELQSNLLQHDAILLSYWIGSDHSYRWLISADRLAVEPLPARREFESVIGPMARSLRRGRPVLAAGDNAYSYLLKQKIFDRAMNRGLHRMGAMLLNDLPEGTQRIFFVDDDCLAALPFAALRVGSGTANVYAIQRFSLLREPSASVALYLQQHALPDSSLRVAIFADPVSSPFDPRLAARPKSPVRGRDSFARLERLTGSAEEVRDLLRYAPPGSVSVRKGFEAVPSRLNEAPVTESSILHFAAHTILVPNHPEMTGIVLSTLNRYGKEQDGVVWLKDIYEMRTHLSLVVLSGCETDRAHGSEGESLDNLAYAFFFAGAHSVVGSLWNVEDGATGRLMGIFYQELLAKGKRSDEALRAAQLRLMSDPSSRSPSDWAAFVIEGTPSSYVPRVTEARLH